MTTVHTLRTERLLLRAWRESDRAPFAEMSADPRVMEHFPAVSSREEPDAGFDRIVSRMNEPGFGLWAVEVPLAARHGEGRDGPATRSRLRSSGRSTVVVRPGVMCCTGSRASGGLEAFARSSHGPPVPGASLGPRAALRARPADARSGGRVAGGVPLAVGVEARQPQALRRARSSRRPTGCRYASTRDRTHQACDSRRSRGVVKR